jgi:hypothetical protein
MLTAEMFNWTGHVFMTPRTQLAEALSRAEATYAGVYLLLGEYNGEPRAYVGEGEDISARIRSHDVNKDWWTSAIFVTTAGNKLNKAHVRYLEARLIEEARKIGRTQLDNGNSPSRPGLSEADVAKMEVFLENLLVVLPAVRVDMFVQNARPTPSASTTGVQQSTRFTLSYPSQAITAVAYFVDGEFVVQSGSQARLQWEGQEQQRSSYANLHDELKRAGVLQPSGDHCVFAENYAFSSVSGAAAVIKGRQTQGTTSWISDDGLTYKDWEAKRLDSQGSADA